jgi:hypothetical protein
VSLTLLADVLATALVALLLLAVVTWGVGRLALYDERRASGPVWGKTRLKQQKPYDASRVPRLGGEEP